MTEKDRDKLKTSSSCFRFEDMPYFVTSIMEIEPDLIAKNNVIKYFITSFMI